MKAEEYLYMRIVTGRPIVVYTDSITGRWSVSMTVIWSGWWAPAYIQRSLRLGW